MKMNFTKNRQRGLTLVELMVALVVSLILMGGVIQVFLSNKQTYRLEEAVARTQENVRHAMDVIQREVRMAGYFGCNQQGNLRNVLGSVSYTYNFNRPVEGYEADSVATWDPVITETGLVLGIADGEFIRGGTDILVVRRVADTSFNLTAAMVDGSADIFIPAGLDPEPYSAGDIAVISDCSRSAIFQVTAFDAAAGEIEHATGALTPGNTDLKLTADDSPYYEDASISAVETRVYYVGTNSAGRPTLKMKLNGQSSIEIAEGIENMQVLYGVDTDATPDGVANQYRSADEINAPGGATPTWDEVVSVRIALLVESQTTVLDSDDKADYELLDQTVAATGAGITHGADRRLRYVATSTSKLRNRGS